MTGSNPVKPDSSQWQKTPTAGQDAAAPATHPLIPAAASLVLHLVVLLLLGLTAGSSVRQGLGNAQQPGGTAGGTNAASEQPPGDETGNDEATREMVVHRIRDRDWQSAQPATEQAAAAAQTPSSSDPQLAPAADVPPAVSSATNTATPIPPPIDLDGVLQQLLATAEPDRASPGGNLSGSSLGGNQANGAAGSSLGTLRGAIPGSEASGSASTAPDRGISSAAAGSGKPASLFGVEGSGSRVVYVVDRSDSMNALQGRPLLAAKSELVRSLGALESMQFFQLVLYNNQPSAYRNPLTGGTIQMVQGDDRAIERAQSYIQSFGAFGGTDHVAALRMALRMNPDVIFFLSDGLVPGLTDAEAGDVTRMASSRGVTIHCIEFGTDPGPHPQSFLAHLAAENRGQYRYLDVNQFSVDGDWKRDTPP